MKHPVVHFEIHAKDRKAATEFYRSLFGWHIQPMEEMDYGMVDTHAGSGFNGGITTAEGDQAFATVYIETPDIEATLKKAESLGAKVLVPITEIPDVVTIAFLQDPAGNPFGIVKGDGGPQVSPGDGVPVNWFEIMGDDAQALQDFYTELFEWKISQQPMPGYGIVEWPDHKTGGAIGAIDNAPSYVAIYAMVPDPAATSAKAKELGARIMMEPSYMEGGDVTVGMMIDPQGAMFGFYKSGK
ncbi:MAG: VOC family protein [Actinomycetota bacterium]